jgi:hypothetical protein
MPLREFSSQRCKLIAEQSKENLILQQGASNFQKSKEGTNISSNLVKFGAI